VRLCRTCLDRLAGPDCALCRGRADRPRWRADCALCVHVGEDHEHACTECRMGGDRFKEGIS
jgi:hypothetical protein